MWKKIYKLRQNYVYKSTHGGGSNNIEKEMSLLHPRLHLKLGNKRII